MNSSKGKGSMSTASSSSVWKSPDTVSDQFPAGLRVLVVDDDPTCLMILEKMLRICLYEVTKCNRAELALQILRQNKNGFDIVISDVHMPDMDGFKLLESVGLEMDLPVIMMSADESKNVVMKGITHGACDYLIKPVGIEALKNIWQHVVRKKRNEVKDLEQSSAEEDRQPKPSEDADYSSSANEGNLRNAKKRKDDEEEEEEEKDDTSTLKKPRVVWSVELHQQFVTAVEQLGIDKAVPKKILELMNVPWLTRENVASHLQKYRLCLRRLHGNPHQSTFGQISSLIDLDLQTLAVTGQLPAQSLATLQAAGLARTTTKAGVPAPLEQRNLFSFENPKLRFGEGQQNMESDKYVNLLHGISTAMEPKQLANLHESARSLGNTNMRVNAPGAQSNPLLMQMPQTQLREQMLNGSGSVGNQITKLPSSMGQSIMPNAMSGGVLGINAIADNRRGPSYNPVPLSSSTLNYTMTCNNEMPVNNFPLGRTPGISNVATNSLFQDNVHSNMKAPGAYGHSYDIFNELNQQKFHDWELQNAGLAFDTARRRNPLPGNVDVSPSILIHQRFPSGLQNGQNAGTIQIQNISQQCNSHIENSVIVKTEGVTASSGQSTFFPEHFAQNDLMSAMLKQEGTGSTENEFDFDGYSYDNIPV